VWESWTPADREIVRQASIDAGKQQIGLARAGLVAPDLSTVKNVQALGVNVTTLTPQERDAFVTATRRVYAQWKATIGGDLVSKAEAAIAARK
jgi:TRAP-type transport system periplasmic protein